MPVPIGLRDFHYALLTDDVIDPAPNADYVAPVRLIGAVTANINPNPASETFFADDGPMDTASTLGQIELELSVADIPLATLATLLGHDAPVAGRMYRKADAVAPWVAVGFRSLKSDGTYRFTWLLKGKFQEPEQNNETKGDAINYQPPTITGQFVKRDADDAWILQGDEEDVTFVPGTWFDVATLTALAP